MDAAAAQATMLRPVFGGCIADFDPEIRRRPYHRNCGCALHGSRGAPKDLPCCCAKVSYPMRRSQSWGSLSIASSSVPSDADRVREMGGEPDGELFHRRSSAHASRVLLEDCM